MPFLVRFEGFAVCLHLKLYVRRVRELSASHDRDTWREVLNSRCQAACVQTPAIDCPARHERVTRNP
jgi:hypothetical protein